MYMRRFIVTMLIALLAAPAFAADMPKTEEQKTLYALGMLVSSSLSVFHLTPSELEVVKQGLTDTVTNKTPAVELSAYNERVQQLFMARRKAEGEKQAGMYKGFLEKAASAKGAVRTASGLVYLSLKDGSGATPSPTDTVRVNYRGTFPDGREFDSSYKRGEASELKMDGIIKCWSEGLQKMKTGGKAELVCPPEIAYGDGGVVDLILPYATLVYEVELLDVKK
jgi:FKBP-type peptidyl-prolyl cis-trans isomerase FkpA